MGDGEMKTFGVSPVVDCIGLIVRTDDVIKTETFITKRKADKRIMELLRNGYKFDSTHETLKIETPQQDTTE